MHKDIKKILVTKEEITKITKRLAKELTNDYKDKDALFIGLLKGCIPFMTLLVLEIDAKIELDYMSVSSYHGNTTSSKVVKVDHDLSTFVNGRDVVIVEDIVDSGRTVCKVMKMLKDRGAKSVKVATLLDKPSGRKVKLEPDYVGMIIPNEFVVGFGLDYKEYYRNLPYIGVLKEEAIK